MAQVKPTIVAELPMISPNSGNMALGKLVAKISLLSKQLHSVELSENLRDDVIRELDGVVEDLFSQACTSSTLTNSSRVVDVGAQ